MPVSGGIRAVLRRLHPCGHGLLRPYGGGAASGAGSRGPETIDLCPDTTYVGNFTIRRKVTVIGAGPESTVLNGGGIDVVVYVNTRSEVELRGMKITNVPGPISRGIRTGAVLTLVDVSVTGNTANHNGAGIENFGTLTLIDSSVTDNVCGSQFTAGDGGGIYNRGGPDIVASVTLRGSTVSGNTAFRGGGIASFVGGSTVTLEDSIVSGNTASFGGGIKIADVATMTLKAGSRVMNNTALVAGGIDIDLATVTLEDGSVVSGNTASFGYGGGIANEASINTLAGTLTLKAGSRVTNNRAATRGGGIANGVWAGLILEADDIVTDNYILDGTTLNNCSPPDTIPNCIE